MSKLKTLLGVFVAGLVLATTAAYAEGNVNPYASAQYQFQNGRDGQADTNGMRYVLGNTFNKNWAAEISGETNRADGTKVISSLAEVAVIPSIPLGSSATAYLRAGTGTAFVSGADSFNYYSLEPGVKVAVTAETGIKVAYRFRDAYDNSANAFKTNTVRLGVEQALTKSVSATLGYDRSYGDYKYDAVLVGLNAKF